MAVAVNNAGSSLWNEIKRKLFHFGSAVVPVFYYFTTYRITLICVGFLLGTAIAIEYIRLASKPFNRWFHGVFGSMLRREESNAYSAATYLLLSSFLVILVFHKEIAILCLLFTTFGDGMAAIVGRKFGRTAIAGHKTLEGTLAFAIAAIAVGMFFPEIPIVVRLVGAVAAALIEALPMYTNDNIRVPILSGSIMELINLYVADKGTDVFHKMMVAL